MIAWKIEDVKGFTSKLFVREEFDSFLVKEVSIVTYSSFSIDGRIRRDYFSKEELEQEKIEEYVAWSRLRSFCFSLIKGKKLPESFRIVLQLPRAGTERFAAGSGAGIDPAQVAGLYLNIRYEDGVLYCVTGVSLNMFTMDKTFESEWDKAAGEFLHRHGIACAAE